jgi:glycosyltransferase involved in cell wall biosynthesis
MASGVNGAFSNLDALVESFAVVVVATRNRAELLNNRPIPLILNQTLCPKLVIVVDDSTSDSVREKNEKYISSVGAHQPHVVYVPNRRTPGACGAWNTGTACALEHTHSPESTYLAILDDNDKWNPDYLEKGFIWAEEGFDVVATDLYRITDIDQ